MKYAVTARADIVGSLLRPPELLEARERYAAGGLTAAEFKRIEDRAVDRAIGLQERAGLPVVTDGEMRRESRWWRPSVASASTTWTPGCGASGTATSGLGTRLENAHGPSGRPLVTQAIH